MVLHQSLRHLDTEETHSELCCVNIQETATSSAPSWTGLPLWAGSEEGWLKKWLLFWNGTVYPTSTWVEETAKQIHSHPTSETSQCAVFFSVRRHHCCEVLETTGDESSRWEIYRGTHHGPPHTHTHYLTDQSPPPLPSENFSLFLWKGRAMGAWCSVTFHRPLVHLTR